MPSPTRGAFAVALGLSLVGQPARAQIGAVVNGRVEDAASRVPLVGARVLSPDSAAVFTDSLGNFAILIHRDAPLEVTVDQFGYQSQRFELGTDAPARISVLLVEPAPIELEGITVVEESAIDRVFRQLARRRNAYPGSVAAYDRERLQRLAGPGTAWDFVNMRTPGLFECSEGRSGLCVRGRGPTPRDPYPEDPVTVCVDGWESWAAVSELGSLDMRIVSLVEIYGRGRGGIRVYTAGYLASTANLGRNFATPFGFGC